MSSEKPNVTKMIQAVRALQTSPKNEAELGALLQQTPAAFEYSRWDDMPKDTYVTIGLDALETERGGRIFRSTLRENGPQGATLFIEAIDIDSNMDNGIEVIQFRVEGDAENEVFTLTPRIEASARIFAEVDKIVRHYIDAVRFANEDFIRTGMPASYTPVNFLDR